MIFSLLTYSKKWSGIFFRLMIILMLFFLVTDNALAQKKKKKKNKEGAEAAAPAKKKSDKKSIKELTKSSKVYEGLFTVYQDTTNGSIQLLITEDQLGEEYIYFSQVANGVLDAGMFRGSYRGSKVFKIRKYFDRLEFVTLNTSSYFDPENAIAKSADANISEGIMAAETIVGQDSAGTKFLVKADNLFMKETFQQIKPPRRPGAKPTDFSLGSLSKEKTKIDAIKNYPENTDLQIEYVYSSGSILNGGSRAVTDGRNVSIKVYQSIIKMPENNYKPRIDDPRIGYFSTQVTDMTSASPTPYKDLIHRWYLEKKEPNSTLSEPVEPITWWIENTTPREIRPIIKQAALKWNEAFEKAGFRNAMVVKEQPDDAEWDAGDIRYNVLRWTSSPRPPFGGYGPSFVNPRTGQILGADVMLEFVALTNSLRNEEVFQKAAFEMYLEDYAKNLEERGFDPALCHAGLLAQVNNLFAKTAMFTLEENSELEESKMLNEFLHFLILHELGHTLGLNHNMKASQFHDIQEVNNEAVTSKVGLVGSVMDYPAINFSADRSIQGQYWTTTPGPYDHWAIEFGYKSEFSDTELKTLLSKSTQPELAFGNDADDMRSPGKAIDPRVNVNDMTNDAVNYSISRLKLSQQVATELFKKYNKKDQSYHELRNSYLVVTGQMAAAANTISRYIGGVYVDRAFSGQSGATQPYTPVEESKQKAAMKALNDYVFSPSAFSVPASLYPYLQPQRRGYNFYTSTEDPKIHDRILGIQRTVLRHLLHQNTLKRISDSELYGNEYSLSEFMNELNRSIFSADIQRNVNSTRQNLQIEYTEMLLNIVKGNQSGNYTHLAKSMALYNLKSIRRMVGSSSGDLATRAHKEYLKALIDNGLEDVK